MREETKMTTTLAHEALMTQLWWETSFLWWWRWEPWETSCPPRLATTTAIKIKLKKKKTSVETLRKKDWGKNRKASMKLGWLWSRRSLCYPKEVMESKMRFSDVKVGDIMVWIMVRDIKSVSRQNREWKKEKKKRRHLLPACPPLAPLCSWVDHCVDGESWMTDFFFPSENSLFGHFASGPWKWLNCESDYADINIRYRHLIQPTARRSTAGGENLLQARNYAGMKLISWPFWSRIWQKEDLKWFERVEVIQSKKTKKQTESLFMSVWY